MYKLGASAHNGPVAIGKSNNPAADLSGWIFVYSITTLQPGGCTVPRVWAEGFYFNRSKRDLAGSGFSLHTQLYRLHFFLLVLNLVDNERGEADPFKEKVIMKRGIVERCYDALSHPPP